MLARLAVTATVVALGALSLSSPAFGSGWLTAKIQERAEAANYCNGQLGRKAWPISNAAASPSANYKRWALALWRERAKVCKLVKRLNSTYVDSWGRIRAPYAYEAVRLIWKGRGDPRYAGSAADQAIRVIPCESPGPSIRGEDIGQYKGLFQMGRSERAQYARGAYARDTGTGTVLDQVWSGYNMFVRNGRSWTRWACRPDGTVAY